MYTILDIVIKGPGLAGDMFLFSPEYPEILVMKNQ